MGKEWDKDKGGRDKWIAWLASVMRECLRVMKPGAHGLVWALPRTSHWTALALEEAGFEIKDRIAHVFGCLSEDTELYTSRGWVRYQNIIESDLACCYDIDRDLVTMEQIEEVFVYEYEDTAYRIRSDSTDQIVSRGHRCIVEREGGFVFREAETLEQQENIPVLEDLSGLLQALSMQDKGAGRKKQNLLQELHQQKNQQRKKGEEEKGADLSDQEQRRSQEIRGERFTRTDLVQVEPFQYRGVVWCIKTPTGSFLARRNGKAFFTGNSGFPKAADVGKLLDKAAGKEREIVGVRKIAGGRSTSSCPMDRERGVVSKFDPITAPSTPEAAQWDGWKSALKPAVEDWWLVRKPFKGTIAENVLEWGTGGMNIEACRIGVEARKYKGSGKSPQKLNNHGSGDTGVGLLDGRGSELIFSVSGRYPAHLILSHHPDCIQKGKRKVKPGNGSGRAGKGAQVFRDVYVGGEKKGEGFTGGFVEEDGKETVLDWECHAQCPVNLLGRQSGQTQVSKSKRFHERTNKNQSVFIDGWRNQENSYGDSGTAARYFLQLQADPFIYQAKASPRDRCSGVNEKKILPQNNHPTVKSTYLMTYLCRLITPPGETVLDPFCGSGSTGVGALREGFSFLGIEKEENYCRLAQSRLSNQKIEDPEEPVEEKTGQLNLFGEK